MPTYKITRYYRNRPGDPDVIQRGLTLDEAQEHCNDPQTSSSAATSPQAQAITEQSGPWFDGYTEE